MTTVAGTRTRALCVATRCTSVDQFVAMFHRFCGDDQTFFVATPTSRPIGLETAFSIQLADKQPVLRGLCVVLDAWTTADNRYRRPGIRLGIKRLTVESQLVFDRLRAAARPGAAGEATPSPGAAPRAPARTRPPAFSLRTGATPLSVRVPVSVLPRRDDLPAPRAPLPPIPELPPDTATAIEVTRFQVALNVDATPPSMDDVEFKPTQLVPRLRSEHRIASEPAASEADPDAREPAMIVDRPVAPEPDGWGDGEDDPSASQVVERITERVTAEPDPAAGEERAPGSVLVLPANPLQNLSDESLEGFVDCTLYEEAVNVFHPGIDDRVWIDAAEPGSATEYGALPRPGSVPALPFDDAPDLTVHTVDGTESLAVAAASFPHPPPGLWSPPLDSLEAQAIASGSQPPIACAPGHGMPPYTSPPPTGSWPPYGPAVASGAWPPYGPAVASGAWPPSVQPPPSGAWLPAEPVVPIEPRTPPPGPAPITTLVVERTAGPVGLADWRRWLLIGGTAVVALVLAFLLARLARGAVTAAPAMPSAAATKSASRAALPPAVPRVAIQPPAAHVEAAAAETDDEADEPMPPPGAISIVGSGPCRFTVATAPAGSLVRLDEDPLGAAPLMIEASCDRHKLDVSHARYQMVTRWITLAADHQDRVELNLPRPIHAVAIASSPSGAVVAIDGRRVGTTPAELQLPGFTRVNLTLTKPGFRPVTRRIYSKLAQDRVAIKLVR